MKKATLLLVILLSISIAQAQVAENDSISTGSGYNKMSFYSFTNGEQANVNGKDWDLQIWTKSMDASIRTNSAAGVVLYALNPLKDDTTFWNAVDTVGKTVLYNSDQVWDEGAFNAQASGHPDYGWGTYDMGSHNLLGKKIFVIKTINGNFKKVWIRAHITDSNGAQYFISFGNLDGSNEYTDTINKTTYSTKSFIYYAIDSMEVKDIEPVKTDWDVVFRRYYASQGGGVYYPVSGVLTNPGVEVAEARGVDVGATNDYSAFTFNTNISEIGSDWKILVNNQLPYIMDDSLAFFVKTIDTSYYKLVFTGFTASVPPASEPSVTYFTKTELPPPAVSVTELSNLESLVTYPNPATDRINTLFALKDAATVTINVIDLSGKTQMSHRTGAQAGLNNFSLNISQLSQGFYFLSVEDGNQRLTYKFVKN